VARPEHVREHATVPPAHFNEVQAEQALWQEFRDHGASLNNALNEALRIDAGLAWQIFKVRGFVRFWSPPIISSARARFLTLLSSTPCPLVTGAGELSPGEVRPPRPP
jgi:hypothetical protein